MMLAVYLVSRSVPMDWLGLAIALSIVGLAGALSAPRRRRLVIGLAVAGALAYTATQAEAVYINCPPLWKYLGVC